MRIENRQPSPEEFDKLVEKAWQLPVARDIASVITRFRKAKEEWQEMMIRLTPDDIWSSVSKRSDSQEEKREIGRVVMTALNFFKERHKGEKRLRKIDIETELSEDLCVWIAERYPTMSLGDVTELFEADADMKRDFDVAVSSISSDMDLPTFDEIRVSVLQQFVVTAATFATPRPNPMKNYPITDLIIKALLKKLGLPEEDI